MKVCRGASREVGGGTGSRKGLDKPKDKVILVYYYFITEHYCAYLKTKRTNLGSLGSNTTSIYLIPTWSTRSLLVCALMLRIEGMMTNWPRNFQSCGASHVMGCLVSKSCD